MELTESGLNAVAAWHGVRRRDLVQANVLVGPGRRREGRVRRSLLRNFDHTQGVYDFFVQLAALAARFRRLGWDDELVHWRAAGASTRRWPRPDGYGSYRHDGQTYGFVLEYDRGTEKPRQLRRKFASYFDYRDSGRFERDFDGFPTILVVSTTWEAECRVAAAVRAVMRLKGSPLPILLSYDSRIQRESNGLLGPAWRLPEAELDDRRTWFQEG